MIIAVIPRIKIIAGNRKFQYLSDKGKPAVMQGRKVTDP